MSTMPFWACLGFRRSHSDNPGEACSPKVQRVCVSTVVQVTVTGIIQLTRSSPSHGNNIFPRSKKCLRVSTLCVERSPVVGLRA